jgi:tetratricopeptide (TPR) repeat protein
MRRYWDKLELTYKSVRIRNIQRILNIVQVVLIFILSLVILWLSGVSFKPFYLPLDFLFLFLIVMLLVYSIEVIVFRWLEIGYSKSSSAIHLMTKKSLRVALVILVVSIFILAVPLLVSFAKSGLSNSGTNVQILPGESLSVNFTNHDRLSLSQVSGISVSTQGGDVSAWVLTEDEFQTVTTFACPPTGDLCPTRTGSDFTISPSLLKKDFDKYVLYITSGSPEFVSYSVDVELSPYVIQHIPILALISIITQAVWIGYLLPIKRKYERESIYSRDYVHEKGYAPVTKGGSEHATRDQRVVFETVKPNEPSEVGRYEHEEVPEEIVDIDSTLLQARTDFNNGNFDMALKAYDRVLTAEKRNLMALNGRAKALEFLRKPEDALETYDILIELNPKVEYNWVKTGDLFHQLGRSGEAAERYKEAIALNSSSVAVERLSRMEESVDYLMAQATTFSGHGRYQEALRHYDLALKREPENIRALIGMSVALRELKKLDEAEVVLRKVLDIDFYNSNALEGLGRIYKEKLNLDPNDEKALIDHGDILLEQGKLDLAVLDYNTVLELNPENEEAKIRLDDMSDQPIPLPVEQKQVVEEFAKIAGVGQARALALIGAGYDSVEKLANAKIEDIMKVRGIHERLAIMINASLLPENQ